MSREEIVYEKVHLALYQGRLANRLWQEGRKDEAWKTLWELVDTMVSAEG